MKWEHLVEHVFQVTAERVQHLLNERGQDGWELVNLIRLPDTGPGDDSEDWWLLMKRPAP